MKLRNKKTGEILESYEIHFKMDENDYGFSSLAELNSEWEDVEEPKEKEYWSINEFGTLVQVNYTRENIYDKSRKQLGNYFETREEAEKAVEKLKAWKRLRDKGFKFIEGYLDNNDDFIIKAKLGHVGLIDQTDVHLLFGGEE